MDDQTERMLTTIDNPFNPFTNFDSWFAYDTVHGYNSCAYFARMFTQTFGLDLTLSEIETARKEEAMLSEIETLNISGMYRLVTESDFDSNGLLGLKTGPPETP